MSLDHWLTLTPENKKPRFREKSGLFIVVLQADGKKAQPNSRPPSITSFLAPGPELLGRNRRINQHLRLGHQALEVILALEAFGVDLVDVLGA